MHTRLAASLPSSSVSALLSSFTSSSSKMRVIVIIEGRGGFERLGCAGRINAWPFETTVALGEA